MRGANLRAFLLAHEHHTLHFGREHGGVEAIRCRSCEEAGYGGDPHDLRIEWEAPVPDPLCSCPNCSAARGAEVPT